MWRNLTLNSIVWILLGLFCIGVGAYYGWEYRRAITRMFPIPFGFGITGIAMILCGYTNGFTDYSPTGRKIKKAGALLFLTGLPALFYSIWTFFL